MKKLSDYKGTEAIELWADLFEPFTDILGDEKIRKIFAEKPPIIDIAKAILKGKPEQIEKILKIVDGAEVTGANAFIRFMSLLTDIMSSEEGQSFFASAAQGTAESSGNVTENTEEKQI